MKEMRHEACRYGIGSFKRMDGPSLDDRGDSCMYRGDDVRGVFISVISLTWRAVE